MEDVDIPPFFLCPISLQLITDPVTLSTGITYDRKTIEKWLFSMNNTTCPVTKQPLSNFTLIPNHTLRRLIQSWCSLNSSNGVQRIPTPKPPISKTQILKLLQEAETSQLSRKNSLQRLKSFSLHNETNKRSMESAGVVEFLAGVICNDIELSLSEANSDYLFDETTNHTNEALIILHNLQISEAKLKHLLNDRAFIASLTKVLQSGNYGSRAYSTMLLKSMFEVGNETHLINVRNELFIEAIQVLKDQISQKATKAALKLLISLCSRTRNKVKAVEAGGIRVLIELLLDMGSSSQEKRSCEMILVILNMLCGCAEGRAELLKHGAGLAVVSKKIMRVSEVANEMGVGILYSIARFSGSASVVREMVEMGIVMKLLVLIQVGGHGNRAKEKAREILKLHCGAWRNSHCLPFSLRSAYPI